MFATANAIVVGIGSPRATWPTVDCPFLTRVWPALEPPETWAASGHPFQGEDSKDVAELLVGEVVFAEHVDVCP